METGCADQKGNVYADKKERALIFREPALQKPSFPNILFGAALPQPLGLPGSSLTPQKAQQVRGREPPHNQDSKAVNAWRTGCHGEHRADRISSALSSEHRG